MRTTVFNYIECITAGVATVPVVGLPVPKQFENQNLCEGRPHYGVGSVHTPKTINDWRQIITSAVHIHRWITRLS